MRLGVVHPKSNLSTTNLQHTSLELFALAYAVTQLVQTRIDNPSGLSAIPQCYDDLMANRCKGNIENVIDAQLCNHRCFRRCKLSIKLEGCT